MSETKPKSSTLNLLVDYGPLVVFFVAYKWGDPKANPITAIVHATLAFMVATVVALILSNWRLGKISPMLWLSSVLIIGFGGLTVWLNDPFYIQVKPTVIYLLFAGVLFAGLLRGKAMLKVLLQSAFDGLDDAGWLKLSRNWAVFFLALAILNEILRRTMSFDDWLTAKVWGVSILSFVFTFAQLPMLLRHGLAAGEKAEAASETPHD